MEDEHHQSLLAGIPPGTWISLTGTVIMRRRSSATALLTALLLLGGAGAADAATGSTTANRYIGCTTSTPFFKGLGGYAYNRAALSYKVVSLTTTVSQAASTLNSYECAGKKPKALYTQKTDIMTFSGPSVTSLSVGSGGASVTGGVTSKKASWTRKANTANLTNYYSNVVAKGAVLKFTYQTQATWSTRSDFANGIYTSVSASKVL